MASQEDYLDQLLQNLSENHENEELPPVKEELSEGEIDELLQSVMASHEEAFGAESEMVEAEVPMAEDTDIFTDEVDLFAEEEVDLFAEDTAVMEDIPEELPEELLVGVSEEVPAEEEVDLFAEDSAVMEDIPEELPEELLEGVSEEVPAEEEVDLFADDTAEMTEEEINRLLQVNQNLDEEDVEAAPMEESLSDLLSGTDDADLMEIQSLLQKAENNEVIDAEDEENPSAEDVIDKNTEKKMQREAQKAEKKAAREAAKAARKAAKEAKKAEKKAAKVQNQDENSDAAFVASQESVSIDDFSMEELGTVEQEPSDKPLSAEDELMRELEGFDFLNDITGLTEDKSDLFEAVDSASADSLNSIMEQGKTDTAKKGFFARLVDFINEDDEEPEEQEIQLSDENQSIIKDMDKEKKKRKKIKKGQKNAEQTGESGEEGGEKGEDSKKGKKEKKEKKPKKEKPPKVDIFESNSKKIPGKHIAMVLAICASIGLAILLFVNVVGDYSVKRTAKKAFYVGDYQTCYQSLFGKELNETELVMYSKSESILSIRLWIREYELLAGEGQEVKALDSLLQAVNNYPTLYNYALKWNAETEVAEAYNQILWILSEKYHLSEEQAMEINNEPEDVEYTRMVMAIARGDAFGSWNGEAEAAPEILLDPLPEEEEMADSNFVDNK